MLNANLLIFSRSLTKDYRWIYLDKFLGQADKDYILNDIKEFEKNKDFYSKERHLIIRRFKNSIVIYRFSETDNTDQNSRRIFALIGCVFSGIDFKIAQDLIIYITSYLFVNSNKLNAYQDDISDVCENSEKLIEFNLDHIIDEYKRNEDIISLSDNIIAFIKTHPNNSFIVTSKEIKSISDDNNQYLPNSQYSKSIDNLLNNIEYGKTPWTSYQFKKDTKKHKQSKLEFLCSFLKQKE